MNIFISGASGLVGGNCLRHFKEQGWNVVGSHLSYPTTATVFYNTLEPQHPDNVDIVAFRPDVILHCGALTHVDYCEGHPEESYEKTVQSTLNLIEVAKTCGAQLVYMSTDYVFDGKAGPYSEEAEVNPLSVYARHKLAAETMVLEQLPESLVLRITNVYGDELRGKNFVSRILEQCKAGKALELRLPYDQFASPVNAYDVARALYLLLRDRHQGIFHIAGTDYCNRVELAGLILKYFPDATYTLEAVSTDTLQQPAARPLLGGFVKKKFATLYPEFLFGTVEGYVKSKLEL